jgi:hypothetical protein
MPAIRTHWSIIALVGLLCARANAADGFPYEAFVCTDAAEVVAGPGHRHYVTDRLTRGTKVEIYREEASGWLAIRPPEGSFSWVPSEFVERTDGENLGRVKETTGAWIGTTIEHVSEHRQEVTLKVGELVQILGERSVGGKSGNGRAWLKISPPAGEYRWIYLRDVSRQKPEDEPRPQLAASESSTDEATMNETPVENRPAKEPRRLELSGSAIALHDIDTPSSRIDRNIAPAQYRSATSSDSQSRTLSPDGFVPRKRREQDSLPVATPSQPRVNTVQTPAQPRLDPDARFATAAPVRSTLSQSPATAISSGLSAEEITHQLDQIEVDLSLMVAEDRSQWNLTALTDRVNRLVESGADPVSRGRARLVLDKIKHFDDAFDARTPITSRSAAVVSNATPSTGSTTEKTAPVSSSLADPRYDAQGWLKPVISRKGGKPVADFAVVDREGQPLCFITPSPGLNLRRYENKHVGLYGRRGYLEELKKPHLLAERVIELDSRLR